MLFDSNNVFWGIFNPFLVVWWLDKYFPMILQNKIGQRRLTANDFEEKKHNCTSSILFLRQKLDAKPFLVLFDIYSVFWGIFNPFTVVWLKNKYCPMILQNKTGQRNSTANDFEGGKWPHRLHTYYKKVTTIEILARPGPDVPCGVPINC